MGTGCSRIDRGYCRRLQESIRKQTDKATDCGSTCAGTGTIDGQDVRFSTQQLRRLVDDIQRMLLLDSPFSIKVVLEELDIGLALLSL